MIEKTSTEATQEELKVAIERTGEAYDKFSDARANLERQGGVFAKALSAFGEALEEMQKQAKAYGSVILELPIKIDTEKISEERTAALREMDSWISATTDARELMQRAAIDIANASLLLQNAEHGRYEPLPVGEMPVKA